MLDYEYEIIYKKGKKNIMENEILRKYKDTNGLLCAMPIPQFDQVEGARIEWDKYENIYKIIKQLQEDPNVVENIMWKNDFLWYQDHLHSCNDFQLKQKVLS